ncbi:hypothetical protein ACWGJ9_07225 [Curtobacterium citreum]
MATTVRVRPGLLERLRKIHGITSEEHQARLMGVDRTTLRRVDRGATPSGAFMGALCETYGLGIGEAFELIRVDAIEQAA